MWSKATQKTVKANPLNKIFLDCVEDFLKNFSQKMQKKIRKLLVSQCVQMGILFVHYLFGHLDWKFAK